MLLGLRASLYRPYQTRTQIAMGDCYVLASRSGVTWTARPHIVCDVSCCSSLQVVARRRLPRTRSPSGSGRRYLRCTRFRGDPYRGLLRSSFKKNFAVAQVLTAGTWCRHTIFTRHNLRDMAHRSLETSHLVPVVAAKALV